MIRWLVIVDVIFTALIVTFGVSYLTKPVFGVTFDFLETYRLAVWHMFESFNGVPFLLIWFFVIAGIVWRMQKSQINSDAYKD